MKTVQLSGSLRANVGKKDAKALRKAERVPCVLYGSGEQTYFSIRTVEAEKLIYSPDVFQIEIDIDGTKKRAIIQDEQTHPVTDKPVHIDFLELADDRPVKVGIPIRFVGRARGVVNGGRFLPVFRSLRVEGLPKDLPAIIEIDVTPLRIGQLIRVEDVKLPGVKSLEDPRAVIVAVKMARGAVNTDDEEEEGAEESAEGSTEETSGEE